MCGDEINKLVSLIVVPELFSFLREADVSTTVMSSTGSACIWRQVYANDALAVKRLLPAALRAAVFLRLKS